MDDDASLSSALSEEEDEQMSDGGEDYDEAIDYDAYNEMLLVTDDYLCEKPYNSLEDYNLDVDYLKQLELPKDLDEWKDLNPSDPNEGCVTITFDEGRAQNWHFAKQEFCHLNDTITRELQLDRLDSSPSLNEINRMLVLKILGPDSRVGSVLCRELSVLGDEYCAFMQTICIQAAYAQSTTQMFASYSQLKDKPLMSEERFTELWNQISEMYRVPDDEVRSPRSLRPLWTILEKIVNEELRKWSIEGRTGCVKNSLDDDKVWFLTKRILKDMFNVKYTTHTQANRKGMTAHSSVTTGLMVPQCIAVERQRDDACKTMKRILNTMYDADGSPDLTNVHVHSDRGYMGRETVDYMLQNGADFLGTTKRIGKCWPFTYNQKVNPEVDARKVIETEGHPTLYVKKTGDRKKLYASAFRNGTNAVATGVSTLHQGFEWDAVLLYPNELDEWRRDKDSFALKFFNFVKLNGDLLRHDDIASNLLQKCLRDEIKPCTLRQGTADWHHYRRFSLTSSHAHPGFEKGFTLYKDDDWLRTGTYLYGEDGLRSKFNLGGENTDDDAEVAENNDNNDVPLSFQTYLSDHIFEDDEDETYDNSDAALKWLRSTSEAIGNEDKADEQLQEYKNLRKDDQKRVKEILSEFNPYHIETTNPLQQNITQNLLRDWLMRPQFERNLLFYKKNPLKAIFKKKKMRLKQEVHKEDHLNVMIKAIAASEMDQDLESIDGVDIIVEAARIDPNANLSPEEVVIKSIIERSFLKHQKGVAREHCTLGHKLEKPILKKFIQKLPDVERFRNINVRSAYSVGLAAKKGHEYAKDSVDFVLVVEKRNSMIDEEPELWGFEAKGRVVVDTANAEKEHVSQLPSPFLRFSYRDAYKYIKDLSERFQILQHAYVYNFSTVVLAIADRQSELIAAYVVDFDNEVKASFGAVLEKLKDTALYWAYPTSLESDILPVPDNILVIGGMIPTVNGDETFQGTANLWHTLRKLESPFPSFLRLLPALYAYWNVVKGGSDTTTKLMDKHLFQVPRSAINMETVACTRLVQFTQVLVHRLFQVNTASQSVDEYPDLRRYRDAATKRFSFQKSLLLMAHAFKVEYDKINFHHLRNRGRSYNLPRAIDTTNIVNGIAPVQVPVAGKLSTITPKKMIDQIKKGQASDEICQMVKNCLGFIPLQDIRGAQTKCSLCKRKTSWYCSGCKRWLCLQTNVAKAEEIYGHIVKGTQQNFVKTCYHRAHEVAWTNETGGNNENSNNNRQEGGRPPLPPRPAAQNQSPTQRRRTV